MKLDIDIEEVLNSLSELVYISDEDTHELLYINESGKRAHNLKDDYLYKPCYKVLQGKEEPCEFCDKKYLDTNGFYKWEYFHEGFKKYFISQDKKIKFQGRNARFQMAIDITEVKQQNEILTKLIEHDNLLISCIKKLHERNEIRSRINAILEKIGQFTQVRSLYIFEKGEEEKYYAKYKWSYNKIVENVEEKQREGFRLFNSWEKAFESGQCVMVKDVEEIKQENEKEYLALKAFQVESLLVVPLIVDNEIIGFMGMDNAPNKIFNINETFFATLGYFMSAVINKEKLEKELYYMGFIDRMTEVNNRNKFINDIKKYKEKKPDKLGIVYLDLNGLKKINDTYGHEEGDRKIIQFSTIIKSVFSEKVIYRIGGDEFCVICTPIEENEFKNKAERLKKLLSGSQLTECSAAVGYQYNQYNSDITKMFQEADKKMYQAKKEHYKEK